MFFVFNQKTAYEMRISDWSSDVCSADLLVVVERLTIKTLEPVDLGEHIVAQHRPVELAVGDVPAELARVVDILGEMRAVNEQFLGHAAADDTGAADPILLRHRHARAVRGPDAHAAAAPRTRPRDTEDKRKE